MNANRTLAFLEPASAGSPPGRSPLADSVSDAGAAIELRDGWEVAVSFGDPDAEAEVCARTVGFADVSHLTKLEFQGGPAEVSAALGSGSSDTSTGSTLGLARKSALGWICALTPTKGLALGQPGSREELSRELADKKLRVCDLTGAWGALVVVGPSARELFARFCAVDLRDSVLPVQGIRPGSVARTPGYVLREDSDRFLLLFGAAYGAYMWQVVADAADRLEGRPVGVDILPPLGPDGRQAAGRAVADADSKRGGEDA